MKFTIILMLLSSSTFAIKPKVPEKASEKFMLFDDGCEHQPISCSKQNPPAKLIQDKKISGYKSYMGSVQTEFSDKNEAAIDAWEHYFSDKQECEEALKKLNKVCDE